MRISKGYYSELAIKGVSHDHEFWQTQRQAKEWESFIMQKKKVPGAP